MPAISRTLVFFGLIFFAVLIKSFGTLSILSDAPFYFFELINRHYFMTPFNRDIHILFQSPVLWMMNYTSKLETLELVFSLSYSSSPLISLLLSWISLKGRKDWLMIWPPVLLLALPWIDYTNEVNIVAFLSLPIVMAILASNWSLSQAGRNILCLAAIWYTHHFASAVFAVLSCFAALSAFESYRSRENSRPALAFAWLTAFLALLALSPLGHFYGIEYEVNFQTELLAYLSSLGFYAYLLLFIAALLIIRLKSSAKWQVFLILLLLASAGLFLSLWVQNPQLWQMLNQFKSLSPLLALPFLILACIDSRRDAHQAEWRSQFLVFLGMLTLIIGLMQSLSWQRLAREFEAFIEDSPYPCIPFSDLESVHLENTSYNNWSAVMLSLIVQGQRPEKILLPDIVCQEADFALNLPYTSWQSLEYEGGWFQLDSLAANLQAQNP